MEKAKPISLEVKTFPFLVRMLARNASAVAFVEKELEKRGVDFTKETGYKRYLYLRGTSLRDELLIRKIYCYMNKLEESEIGEIVKKFCPQEYKGAENAKSLKEYIERLKPMHGRTNSFIEAVAVYMFVHTGDEDIEPVDMDSISGAIAYIMANIDNPERKVLSKKMNFRPIPWLTDERPLDIFADSMGMRGERQAVSDILESENLMLRTFSAMDMTKSDNKIIAACFDDLLAIYHNKVLPMSGKEMGLDYGEVENAAMDYAGITMEDDEDEKTFQEFMDRMMPAYFYLNVIKRLAKAYSRAKDIFFSMENSLLKKKEAKSWQKKYEDCQREKEKLESSVDSKVRDLQNKLNELQLAFDKKKIALSDAEEEIALLKQGLSEIEEAETAEETDEITTTFEEIGDGSGVLLFGGHERFQQKYERRFPNIRTFSPDQDFDANVIKGARIVCVNAKYMPHKHFFKLIAEVRKYKKRILYVK